MRDIINVKTSSLMAQIIRQSAAECGVTVEAIMCRARPQRFVTARQVAAYLLRKHTTFSSPAIAKAMGRDDHTTVLHNAKAGRRKLLTDAAFAGRVNAVVARLGL